MILVSDQIIHDYTARGWWGTETISDLFLKNVQATPHAIAIADAPNLSDFTVGKAQRWTYTELAERVDRLASALVDANVHKDDVIIVQLPNIVELVTVYLATARIGAILSPVAVQYRTHELSQILALTTPKVYITTTNFNGFDHLEMARHLQLQFPSIKTIIALGESLPDGIASLGGILATPQSSERLQTFLARNKVDANDIMTICWTSGTEAEPKGVPRSHNHWISIAYASTDAAEMKPGFNLLNPFPMVNMSAIGGMLVPWLQTGGKLVMHQPFTLPMFLKQITTEEIDYTLAPPVVMNLLLRNPGLLANTDLSRIKNFGSGSSPLSPWMTTQWKEKYNINVLNFFGSNEGKAFVSAPDEITDAGDRARFFPRYGAPVFRWSNRVSRGMETKLISPATGKEIIEPNQVGEMMIKGPTVFPGYWNRKELTQRAFDTNGFFHTGDLFAIDGESNNRYRLIGRLKDIIIRGGMNISPEELETLLIEHPKIADVAVIGVPEDQLDDEMVCAVVVPKKEQTVTLTDVNEFLRTKDIAAYKLPKKLIVLDALLRNPLGKVVRRMLKEMALVSKETT